MAGDGEQKTMDDWITTSQAGKILGVTPARVRQLIRGEILEFRIVGKRMYLINPESVYEYDRDRG